MRPLRLVEANLQKYRNLTRKTRSRLTMGRNDARVPMFQPPDAGCFRGVQATNISGVQTISNHAAPSSAVSQPCVFAAVKIS